MTGDFVVVIVILALRYARKRWPTSVMLQWLCMVNWNASFIKRQKSVPSSFKKVLSWLLLLDLHLKVLYYTHFQSIYFSSQTPVEQP